MNGSLLLTAGLLGVGCNAILGIEDHSLAPDASPGAGFDAAPSEAGIPGDEGMPGTVDSALDSGSSVEGSVEGSTDSGVRSEGGAVAAVACADDAGACVVGGVFSVGRVADDAGAGTLPNGDPVTVTDDGFEWGGATCDPTGKSCVTGAIAP
jgi:hypothetical protein